jgi:nucleotide-binding universal stress UspA family protein
MQTIMVSLDGTTKDDIAIPVAAAIADHSGLDIHLVHVIDALTRRAAAHAALLGLDEGDVTGRRAAEARITELATSLATQSGRRVTWDLLESVNVAPALIRHAAERDTAVVVMATRAAGLTERAFFGSVAHQVVRESLVPVVVVPPRAAYLQGMQPRFRRVLVPLDGSDVGARALDLLLGLPRASSLEYVLLEVVLRASDRTQAEVRLAAAADRVRARGATRVDLVALEASEPVTGILDALRELLIDSIAMSTHARSGIELFVHGSVAEEVVRASEVPILLLSPAVVRHPSLV